MKKIELDHKVFDDTSKKRHKCSACGRVRFQKYLVLLTKPTTSGEIVPRSRFGHAFWFCVDNPDCLQQKKRFYIY